MHAGTILLLLTLAAGAAERTLELHGQIEPAPGRASVTLDAALGSFTTSTVSDARGRFKFKKLQPGPYSVTVFITGAGVSRRTVEVTPSLADAKGRVHAVIPFNPSPVSAGRLAARRNTVSVSELSIPDRAKREYDEAQQKLGSNDVEGAVRHLKRAVEIAPDYMMAWNNLGTIAYHARRFEDAETYFRKALEARPGAFPPAVNLGGVLLYTGKHEEALKFNQYAVETRPRDALANSQLGMTYFLLKQDDQALRYLNAARELDPSHFSNPQLLMAEIHIRRRERIPAIKELKEFLSLHPDSPEAPKVRGFLERLTNPPATKTATPTPAP